MPAVPAIRITKQNKQAIRTNGDYVLYWMIASRRVHFNFALDRALEIRESLKKPLLIFEPLRVDYRWARHRLHRFVLDGTERRQRAPMPNRENWLFSLRRAGARSG